MGHEKYFINFEKLNIFDVLYIKRKTNIKKNMTSNEINTVKAYDSYNAVGRSVLLNMN